MRLEYCPPSPELAAFVTTFFLLRCDEREIIDVQPAGVGLLAFVLRGAGTITMPGGMPQPGPRAMLLSPMSAAAPVIVAGPWHVFGASLSPLGWAALTGLDAHRHANRLWPAEAMFGAEFAALGAALAHDYAQGGLGVPAMAARVSAAIAPALRPVAKPHLRLFSAVAEWLGESLNPALDALYARAPYSPRQTQRLVTRYFGLPPAQLARKYRALRAATVLADPATTADQADRIADAFYDQPHMIREIRHFVGRTPTRLADPSAPLVAANTNMRNYREFRPRVAPLPREFDA